MEMGLEASPRLRCQTCVRYSEPCCTTSWESVCLYVCFSSYVRWRFRAMFASFPNPSGYAGTSFPVSLHKGTFTKNDKVFF